MASTVNTPNVLTIICTYFSFKIQIDLWPIFNCYIHIHFENKFANSMKALFIEK